MHVFPQSEYVTTVMFCKSACTSPVK